MAGGDGCRADAKIAASAELQAQLRLQDEAAQAMQAHRVADGALEFHRIEADPVVVDGQVQAIHEAPQNRATDLIEDFMMAATRRWRRRCERRGGRAFGGWCGRRSGGTGLWRWRGDMEWSCRLSRIRRR